MLSSNNLADTCLLAAKARSKLTREASRADHNLRILVSHANLLDNLMDNLAAHREEQKARAASAKVSFSLPVKEEVPAVPVVSAAAYNDSIEYEDDYEDENSNSYEYDFGTIESYDDSDSDSETSSDDESDFEDSADIRDEFYEVASLHKYFHTLPSIAEDSKEQSLSHDSITVSSSVVAENDTSDFTSRGSVVTLTA